MRRRFWKFCAHLLEREDKINAMIGELIFRRGPTATKALALQEPAARRWPDGVLALSPDPFRPRLGRGKLGSGCAPPSGRTAGPGHSRGLPRPRRNRRPTPRGARAPGAGGNLKMASSPRPFGSLERIKCNAG